MICFWGKVTVCLDPAANLLLIVCSRCIWVRSENLFVLVPWEAWLPLPRLLFADTNQECRSNDWVIASRDQSLATFWRALLGWKYCFNRRHDPDIDDLNLEGFWGLFGGCWLIRSFPHVSLYGWSNKIVSLFDEFVFIFLKNLPYVGLKRNFGELLLTLHHSDCIFIDLQVFLSFRMC